MPTEVIESDQARLEAFRRICTQCCEALHVLARLQEGAAAAPGAKEIDDAVRERCLALECPLADFTLPE